MSNSWRWVKTFPGGPEIFTSVTNEEMAALGGLSFGRDCLEIGSAQGYSAIMMAAYYGAKSVHAIDQHLACNSNENMDNSLAVMEKNLKEFRVSSKVHIDRRDSADALPDLAEQGRQFDLAFIDGDHDMEPVRRDTAGARKLVKPGGIMAWHDFGPRGISGVTDAIQDDYPNGILIGSMYLVQVILCIPH